MIESAYIFCEMEGTGGRDDESAVNDCHDFNNDSNRNYINRFKI